MEKMRKLFGYAMYSLLAMSAIAFTSCSDDDDDANASYEGTIVVTPSTTSNLPGAKITFSIAVTSDAELSSVKLDGTEIKSYTTATNADAFTYEYTVPASASVGNSIKLKFESTDKASNVKSTEVTVTVGDPGKQTETISGPITASRTFSKDKYYLLTGNVYVQSGATLTIEAGTVIFGDKVTKGALIIDRGAKIHAVGTATSPIIFTSSAPANYRNYGDWGGVVLLGKAPNNQGADWTIEGVSAPTGDDGKYGGSTEDDNSGEFQYCRIEFAGIALSTDNELNGLTFGSVGSGTTVDHVQVSYSGDDSFEWFGGSVNPRYLIAYRGWDDDFDTDFGFHGTVQYGVSFRDPNISDKSGSNGFESDNDGTGSGKTPKTSVKFSNITWFGPHVYSKPKTNGSAGSYTAQIDKGTVGANYLYGAHVRRNTDIQIYNSVFVGSNQEGIHFDATGVNAVVKGNYYSRIGIGASNAGTVKKVTAGNGYDDSNFDAENFHTATGAEQTGALDLSTIFTGIKYNGDANTKFTNNANIDQPSALLASGSSLLTTAVDVPAGLDQTEYVGAFDATNNWASGTWINYSPTSTGY